MLLCLELHTVGVICWYCGGSKELHRLTTTLASHLPFRNKCMPSAAMCKLWLAERPIAAARTLRLKCIADTCAMLPELRCTAPQLPQAWLRVALGYHTVAQVAVGWVVGGGSAAAWHAWGRRVALPAVRQSPQLQVS